MEINEDNANQQAFALIQKRNIRYEDAMSILHSLRLCLNVSEVIGSSPALQAALLTAVNTGKRAFLGGVFIIMPRSVMLLVPWPGAASLNDAIAILGGQFINEPIESDFELTFGKPCSANDYSTEVVCNSWQGGINPDQTFIDLEQDNFGSPLGGIAAGAYAVGVAFMVSSKLDIRCADRQNGVSLWRPDLPWLDPKAIGVKPEGLPEKIWLLGLGHLGQGYIWSLGLLQVPASYQIKVSLQDYDKVTDANYSAGLLCEDNTGIKKTRVCASWLEERGFETIIIEKIFDENTRVHTPTDEPLIALCGFDNSAARRPLEGAGFDLIIEAGLGGSLSSFDDIMLHTFPGGSKTAEEIWKEEERQTELKFVREQFDKLNKTTCGVLAQNLAGKSISSSFAGAFTGALVTAEVLRACMAEKRYDKIMLQLRRLQNKKAFTYRNYELEAVRNGIVLL